MRALEQEQKKSKKLEENTKRLEEVRAKTDYLLYQMVPRVVAERLRSGEPALNTCQAFDEVTILFTHVVGFSDICDAISPVCYLNVLFERLLNEFKNILIL